MESGTRDRTEQGTEECGAGWTRGQGRTWGRIQGDMVAEGHGGDTGQGAVGYETAFGEQRMWPVLALLGMALAGWRCPRCPQVSW